MSDVALIFSGQGSQYSGMGKKVYDRFPRCRRIFEEAGDILGRDISRLCFNGSSEELSRTENTQVAIFTVSMAMFCAYEHEIGIKPACAAGHSLGEYAALTSSGAIDFKDSIRLVRARAAYMQEAAEKSKGLMCVLGGIDRSAVERVLKENPEEMGDVVISNYNSPEQIVISGTSDAVTKAGGRFEKMGAKVTQLEIKAPFHSPLMREAADKFKDELNKYTFNEMKWPVISNISALPYKDSGELKNMLADQMVRPVKWEETMKYIGKASVKIAVEMGPRAVLKNLAKKNCPHLEVFTYDSDEDIKAVLCAAAGSNYELMEGKTRELFIEKCIAAAVCTRNRNWDDDEYREGVVKPYREVKESFYQLKDSGGEATVEHVMQAYNMLTSVLDTKRVPNGERKMLLEEIFEETKTKDLFNYGNE